MVFTAKGKIERFNPIDGQIDLVMKEGFLGSEHKVVLKLDKKFVEDIQKSLDPKHTGMGHPSAVYTGEDKFGDKAVGDHEVEIIIK